MRWLVHTVLALPLVGAAQPGTGPVQARLDTNVIRIGEQVRVRLEVDLPTPTTIQWPQVNDTLSAHIEVVRDSGVDTVETTDGTLQLVRTLFVTAFDTGFWAIPPFHFVVNGMAQETKAQLIEVRTVEVDPTKPIRDIKDIVEAPFSLWFQLRENAVWLLAGLVLLALAIGLFRYWKQKRTRVPGPAIEVALPLVDRTLADLRLLEAERIWQRGDHKLYQSRLTDLLRGYIEERYGVHAMESTTDELLRELRVSPLSTDQRGRLENMLRLADMVKFAKTLPSPQENEQMMIGAVRFVQETAPRPATMTHA